MKHRSDPSLRAQMRERAPLTVAVVVFAVVVGLTADVTGSWAVNLATGVFHGTVLGGGTFLVLRWRTRLAGAA